MLSGSPNVAPSERGFSLLETMLTLFITAVVLSLVYSSVRGAGSALQTSSVRNQLYRSTYALLEELSKELASAYLSPNGNPLNGRAMTYFYVENREENGMPAAKLYFTTYGHGLTPMAVGESDQSEVCYLAQYSSSRDEMVLLKKEDTSLDETTCKEEELTDFDRPYADLPVPVATGINPEKGTGYRLVGFRVECRQTTDDSQEPLEEWNSEETRSLPSRVWVTLTYEDDKGNAIPFTKMVQLRLQMLGSGPAAGATGEGQGTGESGGTAGGGATGGGGAGGEGGGTGGGRGSGEGGAGGGNRG